MTELSESFNFGNTSARVKYQESYISQFVTELSRRAFFPYIWRRSVTICEISLSWYFARAGVFRKFGNSGEKNSPIITYEVIILLFCHPVEVFYIALERWPITNTAAVVYVNNPQSRSFLLSPRYYSNMNIPTVPILWDRVCYDIWCIWYNDVCMHNEAYYVRLRASKSSYEVFLPSKERDWRIIHICMRGRPPEKPRGARGGRDGNEPSNTQRITLLDVSVWPRPGVLVICIISGRPWHTRYSILLFFFVVVQKVPAM